MERANRGIDEIIRSIMLEKGDRRHQRDRLLRPLHIRNDKCITPNAIRADLSAGTRRRGELPFSAHHCA